MTEERRQETRHATRIEVDYASEETFLFAYITDISSMGIFIRTEDVKEVGSHLELRFSPPAAVQGEAGSEPFELTGEVMWNTEADGSEAEPGMGIRFVNLERDTKSRLTGLIHAIAYLDDRSADQD